VLRKLLYKDIYGEVFISCPLFGSDRLPAEATVQRRSAADMEREQTRRQHLKRFITRDMDSLFVHAFVGSCETSAR